MFALIVYISIAFALAISVLCIAQLARKPENAAAIAASGQSALIYRKPLYRSAAASTLLFALMLALVYYFDFARNKISDWSVLLLSSCGFLIFLIAALASEALLRYMRRRVMQLQKETISRIFRQILYAGALMGLGAVLLAMTYAWLTQKQKNLMTQLYLIPAYAGALLMFYQRFQVALTARSADYAFELMARQEALLPLAGASNPLWRLRQTFAAINRFLFSHLEYMLLAVVVLTVSHQIETQTKLPATLGATVSLTVFAIGVIATIPALFIMRVREKTSPETFLWNIRIGYVASLGIQAVITYVVLVVLAEMHIKYFWITFVGSLTALLLNVYSAAYVAENHKTARGLIAAAASSVSTVIHRGIAAGMRGAAIPALIVAMMMGLVYLMGVVDEKGEDRFTYGLFALALALTSMVSLFTVAQATAVITPIASQFIGEARLNQRKGDLNSVLDKFRILRSVSLPSYVLHAKIMLSALVMLIFLVYTQILSEAGAASLFKHLTETATLLIGGISSYYLAARVNELVLNLGPLMVRETSRQFREIPGLTSGEVEPDTAALLTISRAYLTRKIMPLFLLTMLLPAIACLFGGTYGLTGYLIGFGFFTFLGANSWLTTGAAWSSARHAAEADVQVSRHTAQLEALIQADIVGDSMHEAAAPTLAAAVHVTIIASLIFTPATLELHARLREVVKTLF